jgi:hypothetical protein
MAGKEVWESRQITNEIAKNNPLNRLISDVVVFATIEVKGVPFTDPPPSPDGSIVELCDNRTKVGNVEYGNGQFFSTLGEFGDLYATQCTRLSLNGNRGYVVKFAQFPPLAGSGFIVSYPPKVSDALNSLHMLLFKLRFIPEDAEVLGGSVYLAVNDTRMKFDILPQKTLKYSSGIAILPGFTLIATNGIVAPKALSDK